MKLDNEAMLFMEVGRIQSQDSHHTHSAERECSIAVLLEAIKLLMSSPEPKG